MPKTLDFPFQLGDPVEHRGIVVAPLFPARDPAPRYMTLDEALPHGLAIAETSRRRLGARARGPQPARRQRAALRRRGARRRQAEPDPQRDRAGRRRARSSRSPSPASRRAAGRHARPPSTRPATSRTPTCAAARRRCSPHSRSPAGSRRARCGTRCAPRPSAWASTPPPAPTSDTFEAHRARLAELEHAFPLQPGQCGALLALGDNLCLDWVSRPDAFVQLWPKLRRGYLLDALEALDRPRTAATDRRIRRPVTAADRRRQPSAGLGEDIRLRGTERDRLRARARRRAAATLGVHQRRGRRPSIRPNRAAERTEVRSGKS